MNFEWIITYIGPVETVGANAMQKCSFVVEAKSEKEYKDSMMFDLIKDKVSLVQWYKIGDMVKVSFNPRANNYSGKYYNNISAWKIEGNASDVWSSSADNDLPF